MFKFRQDMFICSLIIFISFSCLTLGQPTHNADILTCDTRESHQLKQEVESLKTVVVGMSDKLSVLENSLQQITDKLSVLDEIADNTYVPSDYRQTYQVRWFQSPLGSYKYNFEQAKSRCEQEGATIATKQQLQVAWNKGLSKCACGWLADGTKWYPIQYAHPGCGGDTPGLIQCSYSLNDVYCYGFWQKF